MSEKNRDRHNRWRNITVGFRVSPEESEQLNRYVALSGLTKQDYIIKCLLHQNITVFGNPRVYKALKGQMEQIYDELHRLKVLNEDKLELLELTTFVAGIYEGMNKEDE